MDIEGQDGKTEPIGAQSPAQAYVPAPPDEETTGAAVPIDAALLARPVFSIRARIILAFSVIFALCALTSIWNIYTVSLLSDRLHFLEITESYLGEIQQARRYEKNYLLYGTNLDDALEHLRNAETILEDNRDEMAQLTGEPDLRTITGHVADYNTLLHELGAAKTPEQTSDIEERLRGHGSKMIDFATELSRDERQSVEQTFRLARRIPFCFLAVLLVLMILVANFLSRQLLRSLSRFTLYAERIGQGDFTPIQPARSYRDEFSQLALAFNHMIAELDRRHEVLVESHKLRAIGNLVAGVAHELNNPLNNIFLTTSLLLEDFGELSDVDKIDMANDVMKEAERSQHIVRNLLDFARQSETRIEPIQLEAVLRRSIDLVANQVKLSRVHLQIEIPPGLPPIHGDSQMLSQVFLNLILNALDVLPEHGKIDVTVHSDTEPGYLTVVIADNGPGIPEHVVQRIFEPFFTTKKKGRGTGLGLSVSLGIIRKLGGTIRVKTHPGKGAAFSVLLPTTEIPFEVATTSRLE